MDIFEGLFIISAFIFFISMISALLLMAHNKLRTVKIFGWILFVLMIIIFAILIDFIIIGKDLKFLVYSILIISYLLAEFLLDMVFKIDFRSKISLHLPYILLEYAACFSFVFGVLSIDLILGWIISFLFWAFLGVVVYYLVMQRKNKNKG
ncbi:MAG: hypothetical protein P8Y23_14055 [Candidatus Lokiarchaeota archaeon]|jgi:hypothetical protein